MTVQTLGAWLHDLDPFLWRISGNFGVRWYGLAYLAGFVAAWMWLRALSRRGLSLIPPDRIGDAMVPLVLGVIVGGRLGYVLFYDPALLWTVSSSPPWWGLLQINRGGMASHGGIAGVIAACAYLGHRWRDADGVTRRTLPALHLLDLVAAVCPVGLMFGRIANFINGELLGDVVSSPGEPAPWWAVKFPQELLSGHETYRNPAQQQALADLAQRFAPAPEAPDDSYARLISIVQDHHASAHAQVITELGPLLSSRYPSQLFQAFTDGPLLIALLWWIWRKPRAPGLVGSWFMIGYGVMRIVTEVWRLPDVGLDRVLGLSRGQWLSVAMILVGIVAAWLAQRRAVRLGIAPLGGWMGPRADPALHPAPPRA